MFECILLSKHVPTVIIYEWFLLLHPNIFTECEIYKIDPFGSMKVSNGALTKSARSYECGDEATLPNREWLFVYLKRECGCVDDSVTIFNKIFCGTALKTLLERSKCSTPEFAMFEFAPPEFDLAFYKEIKEISSTYFNNRQKKLELADECFRFVNVGGVVNHEYLQTLADHNNINGGHWLILYKPQFERAQQFVFIAIEGWKLLIRSFLFGVLSNRKYRAIGVGSKRLEAGIFLAVYMDKSTQLDVFRLEKGIRLSGITVQLITFKMDIYSACKVRHNSIHRIRPTIYRSTYKWEGYDGRLCRRSMIESDQPELGMMDGKVWYNYF